MKLKDFAKLVKGEFGGGTGIIQCSSIDDLFLLVRKYGLKEIAVDEEDMGMIVQFYLGNSGDQDPNKPKILREGIIDRFLGINLIFNIKIIRRVLK